MPSRVSDRSGQEIGEGKGATVRITFADARKGVRELDLTDGEFAESGMTEDELYQLLEEAREEVWREKQQGKGEK